MANLPPAWTLIAITASATLVAIVFKLLPAAAAVAASATDARLLRPTIEYVGAENYLRLIADQRLWSSLGVSAIYTLSIVVLSTLAGLVLAAALRRPGAWSLAMCTGLLVPAVLPGVVAAAVWSWLYDPSFGLVNQGLARLGVAGPAWLKSPDWALVSLIALGLWREVGLATIVFVAALARLPRDVEAAARCDGASAWQSWRHVTIPMLRPALALVTLTTALRCIEHFTPFYVMTGGGPAGATTSWTLYLYQVGFERYQAGYASAIAVVVSIALAALLLLTWRQLRRSWGAAA